MSDRVTEEPDNTDRTAADTERSAVDADRSVADDEQVVAGQRESTPDETTPAESTPDDTTPAESTPDETRLSEKTPDQVSLDESIPPLRVTDLEKHFGGITAVDGVSFAIERGSLTGLIGPNGAGKSTTFDCITGIHRPDGGTVEFNGEDVTGLRPHELCTRGLVRTFQIARELEEMTVLENMMLAPKAQQGETLWRAVSPIARRRVAAEERELRERVWRTLERFEIDHLAEEHAGNLSGGQRKLLELSRALLTDPDVMLLDEPLAGINPTLEKKLLERIHDLREQGYTFLLVEHDMDVIMEHCERVIVMHQGAVLADGTPSEITANEYVIDAYLGGER